LRTSGITSFLMKNNFRPELKILKNNGRRAM